MSNTAHWILLRDCHRSSLPRSAQQLSLYYILLMKYSKGEQPHFPEVTLHVLGPLRFCLLQLVEGLERELTGLGHGNYSHIRTKSMI